MNPFQLMQLLTQLKSNPAQFLAGRGINLPMGVAQDPESIVRHLVNSGQINQNAINQAMQIAGSMGIRM